MNSVKKRITATTAGILALCLFQPEPVQAMPDNEMGCIARQQGTMKFVRRDQLDRQTIMETVKAQQLQGVKTIDPCLTGQIKNMPASVYAKLAEKHPDKFQPLENPTSTASSSTQASNGAARGVAPQYRYEGISGVTPPDILFFSPASLTNESNIYGTAFTEFFEEVPFFTSYAAVLRNEAISLLQNSKELIVNRANEGGILGGYVITDFENFFSQAALFDGKEIRLIPRLPGEISSQVILLNDPGVAIISSLDENFNERPALYKNGQVTLLDFGPNIQSPFSLSMNNKGIIAGTMFVDGLGFRGFRFDPNTKIVMLLEPLPTEPDAWTMGINNRDNVLGYSFIGGATERIGVWDAKGKFHTYFVEGTPEFPTVSNILRFNDNNEILITFVTRPFTEFRNSYLVPKPGIRLNLADLVTGAPAELGLFPSAINNQGNILGHAGPFFFFELDNFLLERIGLGPK